MTLEDREANVVEDGMGVDDTPSKRKTRGNGTANLGINDKTHRVGNGQKQELQARFMRSLHELEFAGFLKHTGRKADHVSKTVFDAID